MRTPSEHTRCWVVGRAGRRWGALGALLALIVRAFPGIVREAWRYHFITKEEEKALWSTEKQEGRKAVKKQALVQISISPTGDPNRKRDTRVSENQVKGSKSSVVGSPFRGLCSIPIPWNF